MNELKQYINKKSDRKKNLFMVRKCRNTAAKYKTYHFNFWQVSARNIKISCYDMDSKKQAIHSKDPLYATFAIWAKRLFVKGKTLFGMLVLSPLFHCNGRHNFY